MQELTEIFNAFYYLNMQEIKNICERYGIPYTHGKKALVLDRIKQYVLTGEIIQPTLMPVASKAKRGKQYPLEPQTLMLKGSYKNDKKTREFFKQLIGSYFHYTAFGIDWLEARWQQGNPPTYQEFAQYWQEEYARRKIVPAQPKKEWAYLSFLQRYQQANPHASKKDAIQAWNIQRAAMVKKVISFFADR